MQNFGEGIFPKFFQFGVKKFFFGGPTPKPEVELAAEIGGICRARGEVLGGEIFFAKLPRVSEILGVKEKPLAPPSGKSRCQIFPKFGGSQGDPRGDQ